MSWEICSVARCLQYKYTTQTRKLTFKIYGPWGYLWMMVVTWGLCYRNIQNSNINTQRKQG
jgi:hypothetical protein